MSYKMTIKLNHPHERRKGQDNILPLINIVFLLLIFFLMAGTLTKSPAVSLQPPTTKEAQADKLPSKALYVSKEGIFLSQSNKISLNELEPRLKQLHSSDDRQVLYIIADKESDATHLIKIAKLAKKIGIEKVKLLTLRGKR